MADSKHVASVDHVVVLMLERRGFDHMLRCPCNADHQPITLLPTL